MLHIEKAIIVEGKYDKLHLRKITDAPIICTHGFQLYRSKQLVQSIRHYARTTGVILLTDSDGAGFRIRRYLKQCIGESGKFIQIYTPEIEGKEKRKEKYGKERLLGVEGIPLAVLEDLLQPYAAENAGCSVQVVTKADFYRDGLTGGVKVLNCEKVHSISASTGENFCQCSFGIYQSEGRLSDL